LPLKGRGSNINARNPPKTVWEMVCLPKEEGVLGVIDIEKHNEALLLKKPTHILQQR
jgi:hypothetical protein